MSPPVVVRTHRHGDDLLVALDSLVTDVPSDARVVLVRSGVPHGTPLPPRLESWRRANDGRVTVVCEPIPGPARARATGVQAASADVVLFIDDDVTVGQGWYDALVSAMRETDVAAAGGTIVVAWPDGRRPSWLDDRLATYFGERRAGSDHYPFGANMALRTATVARAGDLPVDFGHAGDDAGIHEETAVCERLESLGHRVVDVPEAVVQHHVRAEQVSVAWVLRRASAEGRHDYGRDCYVRVPDPGPRAAKLAGLLLAWPISLLRARWRVYVTARVVADAAYLLEWARRRRVRQASPRRA